MGVKLTTKEFIERAEKVHGKGKYDYSFVKYKGSKSYIRVRCNNHGIFYKRSDLFLKGVGCNKCTLHAKSNTELFIQKAMAVQGEREYDYSKVIYINSSTPVEIICKHHGSFFQIPSSHLNRNGCFRCLGSPKKTTEQFIKESKLIHGETKYNYAKTDYTTAKIKVTLICKEHGEFKQNVSSHLLGRQGCTECLKIKKRNLYKLSKEDFILRAKKVYGEFHTYDKAVYINARTKVSVTCKSHGDFDTTPQHYLNGYGCPSCNLTKGETQISKYLISKSVNYITQKEFKGCKYKYNLRFDFYLPAYNLCIEFDGKQHFEAIDYFGGVEAFKSTKIRDKIKNDYCKANNIKLLRIPYTEINNIESILNNCLYNE